MKQKNASPTREQAEVIRANGLHAHMWTVLKEFSDSMIIRQRFTGEVRHIWKHKVGTES